VVTYAGTGVVFRFLLVKLQFRKGSASELGSWTYPAKRRVWNTAVCCWVRVHTRGTRYI